MTDLKINRWRTIEFCYWMISSKSQEWLKMDPSRWQWRRTEDRNPACEHVEAHLLHRRKRSGYSVVASGTAGGVLEHRVGVREGIWEARDGAFGVWRDWVYELVDWATGGPAAVFGPMIAWIRRRCNEKAFHCTSVRVTINKSNLNVYCFKNYNSRAWWEDCKEEVNT